MEKFLKLRNTDITISRVCLGCWQFNDNVSDINYSGQDFKTSQAIVDKAISLGINFFDTAEAYRNSENVLGRCLEGRRKDVVIASKFGYGQTDVKTGYTAENIEQALTTSLRSLKTDYIDLYQLHWPVVARDFDEAVKEMERQKSLGRIRHYGVCNFGPKSIEEFARCGGKAISNQLPYNLLTRSIEYEVVPLCEKYGQGILAYGPLQQGLLTGKFLSIDDIPEGRRRTRHFNSNSTSRSRHATEGCEKQIFQAINEIKAACESAGIQMSQAAISWVLAKPIVDAVIVGASRPEQVEQNWNLVQLQQKLLNKLSDVTEEVKTAMGQVVDLWGNAAENRSS